MPDLDKEIDEVAETMEKSTRDPQDVLFETIRQLGPEGVRERLPYLSKSERELLVDTLQAMKKAVSMDDQYAAKYVQGKITDTKIQEDKADDDQDEKLVKPAAAEHPHQGTPVDGWDGQVIKAKNKMSKDEAEDKIMAMEEKEHGTKDPKKLVEAEKKEHEMSKSEKLEKKQGVPAGVNPEKQERCVRKLKGEPGKNPYAVCNAAMKKGEPINDEVKSALQEIRKSVEEQLAEFGVEATPELVKGEMKRLLKEEDQSGDAPEMDEKTRAKKESVPALDLAKDSKTIRKAVWGGENDLIKANTLGRNFHFSMDSFIEAEEKAKSEATAEPVKKSESEDDEDLNDIIEKGEDRTWKHLETDRLLKANQAKITGKFYKSFEEVEIAKSMGMSSKEIADALGLSEDEAKQLLGE